MLAYKIIVYEKKCFEKNLWEKEIDNESLGKKCPRKNGHVIMFEQDKH